MATTDSDDDAANVSSPRALLVTGTVGVGKTTVAEAVGRLLSQNRIPNAVVDMDGLRQAWPCPPEDPFNMVLALRNLSGVTSNYVEAGITRLVLAGVIETPSDRRSYEEALGMPLTVCRLRGDPVVVRDRLVRRHADDPHALTWHLDRAPELAAILESAAVDDFAVDATAGTADEIARETCRAVGWCTSVTSTPLMEPPQGGPPVSFPAATSHLT